MGCTHRCRNEVVLGHDFAYIHVHIRQKTHIAVCNYADEFSFGVYNRYAGNFIVVHKLFRFVNLVFGVKEKRICYYAVFASLYLFDLTCLHINRHIFMDYTYSAFSRHRYRKLGLRNRVHRGGNKRSIQTDFSCQPCGKLNIGRKHRAFGGDKEDVVKG